MTSQPTDPTDPNRNITFACEFCMGGGSLTIQPVISTSEPKVFPCPNCTKPRTDDMPMVPYRKVRALKIVSSYGLTDFAKLQIPIERALADKFGQYLMKEGLLTFTTDYNPNNVDKSRITVTAHLGVVTKDNVARSGADAEVAFTQVPLTKEERQRAGLRPDQRARRWTPPGVTAQPAQPVKPAKPPGRTDGALTDFSTDADDDTFAPSASRFSGLEF